MSELFKEWKLGSIQLPNRIVMAPLTRKRAVNQIPNQLMAEHYAARAEAGLIISEATNIDPMGVGYPDTPGIYTEEQVKAWQKLTTKVHEAGGRIFVQLWHIGRHSHSLMLPGQRRPMAPSAIPEKGQINCGLHGYHNFETPDSMSAKEIKSVVNQFARAAANAIKAGFDGVEIHAANGYLIDQFLQDSTNQREDEYGGSFENRFRFLKEVFLAIAGKIGKERTGVRLAPAGGKLGMHDSGPVELFRYVIEQLSELQAVYLHLIEALEWNQDYPEELKQLTQLFRPYFKGTLICNHGFNFESGSKIIRDGHADLVAYGKYFISNPDLVQRYKHNLPLAEPDTNTYYTPGNKGYNDYPVYSKLK